MDEDEAFVAVGFGIAPTSIASLRDMQGRFVRASAMVRLAAEAEVARLSYELRQAIEREFIAGTDSQGQSHNKTGATLLTLKVEERLGDLDAFVSMAGGAPFVEYGFPEHDIPASAGGFLHWTDGEDEHFAKSVHSPGYKGDDFIGRAVRDVDLDQALRRIFSMSFLEVISSGPTSEAANIPFSLQPETFISSSSVALAAE